MPDQTTSSAQSDPTPTGSRGAVIEAFPGELGTSGTVTRAVAHVQIGFDGEKLQFTAVRAGEGDVRGSEQVDLVPLVHLGNAPAPGKRSSEARSASRHAADPISFGSRTRSYAAAAKVNAQSTLARPLSLVWRRPATLLIQPKASSMRLRIRWLAA